jgi:hypothetical protein
MRIAHACLATAVWLGTLLGRARAHESPAASSSESGHEFDDASSLSLPAAETVAEDREAFTLLGVRAAAARLELAPESQTSASVIAFLAFDLTRSSFERRALGWGYSERGLFRFGFGYGVDAAAAYAVGPLLTTDTAGSAFFLRFGAEGGGRVSGPVVARAFADVPIGYRLRRESWQIEVAVAPSLGGIAIAEDDRLSGPFWFRQRVRVRLWHVQLEVEHGETDSEATAELVRAELCAAARRPSLAACAFFESFDRESAPRATFSEVGILLGIGGFWTTASQRGYFDAIRVRRW